MDFQALGLWITSSIKEEEYNEKKKNAKVRDKGDKEVKTEGEKSADEEDDKEESKNDEVEERVSSCPMYRTILLTRNHNHFQTSATKYIIWCNFLKGKF